MLQTARKVSFATGIKATSVFVRLFGTCFNIVFRGQKIGLRYFKIQGTYFKICALLFFFSPMRVKSAENQFSIFPFPERRFSVPIFCRAMSVLRCSGAGRECKTKGGTRAGHRLRLVCLSQLCGYCFSKRAAHPPPGCITALSTSFFVTVCVVTL